MKNRLFIFISMVVMASAAGNSFGQSTVAARLSNIERLLNQSSGAWQVQQSGNEAALDKRQQALSAYEDARDKLSAGDEAGAQAQLNAASRLMFEAIRLATPTSLSKANTVNNYESRRESVISLQKAFKRISTENGDRETREQVSGQLASLIKRADSLLQQNQDVAARVELDKAYHLLKVSIESIRSGQTLVRSLKFDSKQDEYHYEIDRNDTHNMLVKLLVNEKKRPAAMQDKIETFVSEAQLLRQQAENYAGNDAHQQAIELLEQSTRQLVRAIRSAGIYIPG